MRRLQLDRGSLVYIRLDDVEHIHRGWLTRGETLHERPDRYRAAGFVLRAGRRFLTIAPFVAHHRPSGMSASCAYRLPWGAIRLLRVLQVDDSVGKPSATAADDRECDR